MIAPLSACQMAADSREGATGPFPSKQEHDWDHALALDGSGANIWASEFMDDTYL